MSHDHRSDYSGAAPALFGLEGELVSLRISVEPRLLEDLLEALARLDFPVNPQLYHQPAHVTVEFPAYSARVDEVRGHAGAMRVQRRELWR